MVQMEAQVSQLEELKAALESELNQAYCERDELAAELEHVSLSVRPLTPPSWAATSVCLCCEGR